MEVKYILETRYTNGDKYADKFDSIYELVVALQEIDMDNKIDNNQIAVYTEEV